MSVCDESVKNIYEHVCVRSCKCACMREHACVFVCVYVCVNNKYWLSTASCVNTFKIFF